MGTKPLVSCIMPTADRRRFVALAVAYFLRQDYAERELIVVDDGADAVADLMPPDARVRYFRLEGRRSVGAKRNLACEQARGELIAHWDDDDWHAPRRLRYQAEALTGRGADVCGINTLLFYDPGRGQAWKYTYPRGRRFWLGGSSLCYRRTFWESNRFADLSVGEDARFVWGGAPARMLALDDPTFHVGLIHSGNVSPKQTRGAFWRPYPVREIQLLIGDDWPAYHNARGAGEVESGRPPGPGGEVGPAARRRTRAARPGVARPAVAPTAAAHAAPAAEAHAAARGAASPAPARNVFACLAHERQDCVVDLVRNLRYYDPSSVILLYNGGDDAGLLTRGFPFERHGAVLHPSPRPMRWGWLHDFALDCMRFALQNFTFDTLTVVDSDQLGVGADYSTYLGRFLRGRAGLGMLGNSPERQPANTRVAPAAHALKEAELWRPFLRRFAGGEEKFVHWTFWPSTVFTADAARDLVRLFETDAELREIMSRSKIWATEEVVLPTLVALLGYDIAPNPCRYEYVKYRARYTLGQIEAALARPEVFWVHPVARRYDDGLRKHIRARSDHYRKARSRGGGDMRTAETSADELLLTWPILTRMRKIEGWLEDDEADLLIAAAARALAAHPEAPAVVEVGSYCGRSTVVLGSVAKAVAPSARVYAVDPHDGKVGALDQGVQQGAPTLERFRRNIAEAGLAGVVETIQKYSYEVSLDGPVCLLLIDGLHDYANVARDFYQFEAALVAGGYVAFHDYADYYPGVQAFVNEILDSGRYREVRRERSMMVVQKLPAA